LNANFVRHNSPGLQVPDNKRTGGERDGFYTAVAASHRETLHIRDSTLCLCGLPTSSVSVWSFYGFCCEPHFRRKRYHWYQWGKSHRGHNERDVTPITRPTLLKKQDAGQPTTSATRTAKRDKRKDMALVRGLAVFSGIILFFTMNALPQVSSSFSRPQSFLREASALIPQIDKDQRSRQG
jgi:hypothetical protein